MGRRGAGWLIVKDYDGTREYWGDTGDGFTWRTQLADAWVYSNKAEAQEGRRAAQSAVRSAAQAFETRPAGSSMDPRNGFGVVRVVSLRAAQYRLAQGVDTTSTTTDTTSIGNQASQLADEAPPTEAELLADLEAEAEELDRQPRGKGHTQQELNNIRSSADQHGMLNPVLVDASNNTIDGRGRREVNPNWPTVTVCRADGQPVSTREERLTVMKVLDAFRDGEKLPEEDARRLDRVLGELPGVNAVKRDRVQAALRLDAARSNRAIAELVGVSTDLVIEVRNLSESDKLICCYVSTAGRGGGKTSHSADCWCGKGDTPRAPRKRKKSTPTPTPTSVSVLPANGDKPSEIDEPAEPTLDQSAETGTAGDPALLEDGDEPTPGSASVPAPESGLNPAPEPDPGPTPEPDPDSTREPGAAESEVARRPFEATPDGLAELETMLAAHDDDDDADGRGSEDDDDDEDVGPGFGLSPRQRKAAAERLMKHLAIEINALVFVIDSTDPADVDANKHRDNIDDVRQDVARILRFIDAVAEQSNVVTFRGRGAS